MVARPKESRNERETAERGAFAVGRAAPVSRAAPRVALVVPEAAVRAAQRVEAVDHARAVVEAAQQVGREEVAAARDDDSIGAGRPVADERREGRQRREVVDVVDVDEAQRRRLAGVGRRRRAGGEELVAADAAVGARGRRPARLVEGGAGEARRRRAVHAVRQLRRRRRDDRAHPCAQSGASLGCFYHCQFQRSAPVRHGARLQIRRCRATHRRCRGSLTLFSPGCRQHHGARRTARGLGNSVGAAVRCAALRAGPRPSRALKRKLRPHHHRTSRRPFAHPSRGVVHTRVAIRSLHSPRSVLLDANSDRRSDRPPERPTPPAGRRAETDDILR
jgi:hypothetical protein